MISIDMTEEEKVKEAVVVADIPLPTEKELRQCTKFELFLGTICALVLPFVIVFIVKFLVENHYV